MESPHPDDVVLIHDGVRPFVPLQVLEDSVETARLHDAALVAVPVKDTVKVVKGMIAEVRVRGEPAPANDSKA